MSIREDNGKAIFHVKVVVVCSLRKVVNALQEQRFVVWEGMGYWLAALAVPQPTLAVLTLAADTHQADKADN